MNCELHVDIYAPDDELRRVGESYATVWRGIDLPFLPFIGLKLRIPDGMLENDPRAAAASELERSLEGRPFGSYLVKSVIWDVVDRETTIYASISQSTLEQFRACIEYLTKYDGFERLA